MKKQIPFIVIFSALVGGCAAPATQRTEISDVLAAEEAKKQESLALNSHFGYTQRLSRLAFPLKKASLAICEKEHEKPVAGFTYMNIDMLPKEWHEAAISDHGIGESMKITYVVPTSSAKKSGLRRGDVLVSFDGKNLPLGTKAVERASKIWDDSIKDDIVDIVVLRDDERIEISVRLDRVCNYPVEYVNDDNINAFADGESVHINKGLMRFANDEELSAVIAHEIAHNAMQHIEAKQTNRAGGLILDVLVAGTTGINPGLSKLTARAYSQDFEAEADYVGLYLMARAGMNIDEIANFWRRMGSENPGSINKNLSGTHPSSPERFVGIENTVREIKNKIANGEDLLPNLKEGQ